MRLLRRLALLLTLLLMLCAGTRAQYLGTVAPQSVTWPSTGFPASFPAACTGTPQIYTVQNLGQTVHFAAVDVAIGNTTFQTYIQGVNADGTTAVISDIGTLPPGGTSTVVSAVGYYTNIQVVVICTGTGGFTINYVGTSSASPLTQGIALANQVSKNILAGGSAGANVLTSFIPPFGSTGGVLQFQFAGGAGPSGSTLEVQCLTVDGYAGQTQTWTLATTSGAFQSFPVAAFACPNVQVRYNAGAASTVTASFNYNFNPPGFPQQFTYGRISANSAVLKVGPGFLHTLTIGMLASSGAYAIYDNTSCSGTLIADGTVTAAVNAQTLTFDVNFQNGLCISTGGDVTASFN